VSPPVQFEAVRPFLKWAGGKRQLLPRLRPFYPPVFGAYHEPFLGSGAVFFDLVARGALDGRTAVLTDENPDLIGTWSRVRDSVGTVLAVLERLARGHARRGADHYRQVRDREFNPARAAWYADGANLHTYGADLAAMLIYLNRTGFNGLFRLNRRGEFNVPAGRYVNPRISDPAHLRRVASALGAPGVTIDLGSFETSLAGAREGSFVYCDPPYAPLSRTASFASYTAG
jgi:DNA adenine methylase